MILSNLRWLRGLLIGMVTIASALNAAGFAIAAESPSKWSDFQLGWQIKQDPPLNPGEGGSQAWLFWDRIFDQDPPLDGRDAGTRGAPLCLIAPNRTEGYLVWSDRPTFVWRGNAERIEVQSLDQLFTEGVDLDLNSETGIYFLTLDQELQPGQTYQWRIKQPDLAFSLWLDFQMVDAATQAEIAADLAQIESELESDASEEAIALARAGYFADRNLWSDFWREILSVEHPSEDLQGLIAETSRFLCDDDNPESPTSPEIPE